MNCRAFACCLSNFLITTRSIRSTARMYFDWVFRMTHNFEARTGRMQEQYYTVYRDLRSWTAALTFRVRDNSVGAEDFTVAFTFSLKAHPRFGLGRDTQRPYSLLGG